MTVEAETHYARSGDVSIAYQVTGEGPFDVVHVPGFVSHVELAWEVPGIAAFNRRLSSFCRLIRFDKRGTGMSDRVSGVPTLETRMDDVRAVMDAAGSERAALIGVSEGGPMSILFAATYPERAWALALCGTFARERWAPDYPFGIRDEEARREDEEIERSWGTPEDATTTAQGLAPSASAEEQQALATMIRQSASPGAAVALNRMNHESDVRNVLPAIRVPTLVLNREAEHPFTVQGSAYLAEHVPGARHVELPGADHAIFAGDWESYAQALEEFLEEAWAEEATAEPETARVLAPILFTDIVGSTAKAVELGDARWRECSRITTQRCAGSAALPRHRARHRRRRLLRRVRRAARGSAAPCDHRERPRSRHRGAGRPAHGRVRADERQVGGIAVHIGARVAAEAGPGEVVVQHGQDLVAGRDRVPRPRRRGAEGRSGRVAAVRGRERLIRTVPAGDCP